MCVHICSRASTVMTLAKAEDAWVDGVYRHHFLGDYGLEVVL